MMVVHKKLERILNYSVIKNVLFYCSFNKRWPISTIFGTQYTEKICNTVIIHLSTYCRHCTLEKNMNYATIK